MLRQFLHLKKAPFGVWIKQLIHLFKLTLMFCSAYNICSVYSIV